VCSPSQASKRYERKCYICEYGGATFLAAFIKPNSNWRNFFIKDIQMLRDDSPKLGTLVVILSRELDEKLIQELMAFAEENKLTVPIAVLDPDLGLPPEMSISPEAEITVFFFRGKQIVRKLENVNVGPKFFDTFMPHPREEPNITAKFVKMSDGDLSNSLLTASNRFGNSLFMVRNPIAQPHSEAMLNEIDRAAAEIMSQE
jgi:hypothetical protein